MDLLVLILLATVFYTLFDVFASKSGNAIDPNLGSVIFNGLGALIPAAIYLFIKYSKKTHLIPTTKDGMIYSVLAGIAIAIFSILLIKVFEKGGLAYVIPLIYGGSIVLSALIGWLLFKETVNGLQLLGIVVTSIGIGLIVVSKLNLH